jgi:hypothetical protein
MRHRFSTEPNRRSHLFEKTVTLWTAVGIVALMSGCSMIFPPKPTPVAVKGTPLSFDQWRRGSLHCAAQSCIRLYRLEMPTPGELKVEVYSPIGAGEPDFGLMIRDKNNQLIASSTKPLERPRRVTVPVEQGQYTMRVYSQGVNGSTLIYNLVARLTGASEPAQKSASKPPSRPIEVPSEGTEEPEVTISTPMAPAVPTGGIRAEVLDMEMGEGDEKFVLIDAGEPEGLVIGMRGSLIESDAVIGQVEVVEVFSDGSRAALIGPLDGEIGFDTQAVFRP